MNTKIIVSNFIEEIWNQQNLEKIDKYIHVDFQDFSLPPDLPANRDGLIQWITATGESFEHNTVIEEIVGENDKVIIKIRMNLVHTGTWRNFEPTLKEISTTGYRFFKIQNGKIIEHRALIDGNAIENQISETNHGCKIQV